ncbi:uncharacterized protein HMPREF1541_10086 [Cyphellophora europaea CBS 101466]|uniref:Uncharacterized protein n=1 Tax=Cyphellophora europaea (strain CBS 101466) TaxID=1220924 RepID=W2SBB0_CYPE1|nr:uncharacterized protein HMPREF1541_10086 [Cyphellophora europaea CBS 101466]ETN45209.1 hypothetical protein HMPREF1541_10086 [Cyphellophora europaea CBS 101466]
MNPTVPSSGTRLNTLVIQRLEHLPAPITSTSNVHVDYFLDPDRRFGGVEVFVTNSPITSPRTLANDELEYLKTILMQCRDGLRRYRVGTADYENLVWMVMALQRRIKEHKQATGLVRWGNKQGMNEMNNLIDALWIDDHDDAAREVGDLLDQLKL